MKSSDVMEDCREPMYLSKLDDYKIIFDCLYEASKEKDCAIVSAGEAEEYAHDLSEYVLARTCTAQWAPN
eukprot:3373321-Prorocentrum_lima.AAC.1